MTITSAVIHKDAVQADGRRRIQFRYTDHLGGNHLTFPRLVEAAYDANADLLVQQSLIESQLAKQEFSDIIQSDDLLAFQNPQHQTSNELLTVFVYYYQGNQDIIKLIDLKPITDWIASNYTKPQLRVATGLNVSQEGDYSAKVGAVIGMEANVNNVLSYGAFD